MSNFRRLISYIYAYEGGVKGKNIGFAKIDIRGNQCRIQVNVKMIYVGGNDIGVYLLSPKAELLLGRIFIRNGSGEFRCSVNSVNIEGSGLSMDECYGLTIHDVESAWRCYTTIWDDAVTQAADTATSVRLEDVTEKPEFSIPSVSKEIEQQLLREEMEMQKLAPWEKEDEDLKPPKEDDAVLPEEETIPEEQVIPEETVVPKQQALSEALPEQNQQVLAEASVELKPQEEAEPQIEPEEAVVLEKTIKSEEQAVPEQPSELSSENPAVPERQIEPENELELEAISMEAVEEKAEKAASEQTMLSEKPAAVPRIQEPEPPLFRGPEDSEKLKELDRLEREQKSRNRLWEELQKRYAKVLAFDYDKGCEILSIKPQDIGLLPRDIWVYGNNSFLLHGFYNYRHLILAKLNEPEDTPRYLLGVPGHYFSNEKYMASMFGFPHFVLARKQPDEDGRFGYWYTDIRL